MDAWDEVFMDFKLVLNIVCPLIRFGWTMLSSSRATLFPRGWPLESDSRVQHFTHTRRQAMPSSACGALRRPNQQSKRCFPSSTLPQPPATCLGAWCLSAANCVPPLFLRHTLECLYCLQSVLPLMMSRSKHPQGFLFYPERQITDKIHLK